MAPNWVWDPSLNPCACLRPGWSIHQGLKWVGGGDQGREADADRSDPLLSETQLLSQHPGPVHLCSMTHILGGVTASPHPPLKASLREPPRSQGMATHTHTQATELGPLSRGRDKKSFLSTWTLARRILSSPALPPLPGCCSQGKN